MATKKKEAPAIIDSVDALVAKINAMKEAQKVFADFTQDQLIRSFLRQLWLQTNSVFRLRRWQ